MNAIIGQLMLLFLLLYAFGMIFRGILPTRESRSSAPIGSGCLGGLLTGFLYVIILPIIWFTIGLVARVYHRVLIIFTELISGVHDPGTYRTSIWKLLGFVLSFLAFNGFLYLALFAIGSLILMGSASGPVNFKEAGLQLGIMSVGSLVCLLSARLCLRRMP